MKRMQLKATELKSGETVLLTFITTLFENRGCHSSPSHERGQCAFPPAWLEVNLPPQKFPREHFLAEHPLGSLAASCSGTLLDTGCWLWGLHEGFGECWDSFHPILRPELQELVCIQLYKWSAAWVAQDHIANGAVWGWHSCR